MQIGLFIFSIVLILWSIAKSILVKWQIFNFDNVTYNVFIMLIIGIYLFQSALKELIYFKKHKTIIHGADERNKKIFIYSTLYALITIFMTYFFVLLYNMLFYDPATKIFSIFNLEKIMWPGIIVFFYCFFVYFDKKKNIQ